MMATTFVIFALFIAYSYALPLKMASIYVVPIIVQKVDDPQTLINEEPSNYNIKTVDSNSLNIEKRNVDADGSKTDVDDLETAAGTNVLRPLFVYRQQVAYRKRVRDAIRRSRRI